MKMTDKTDIMRMAAVAAVLEHVRREAGVEVSGPAGGTKVRIGWKMAGRLERLGIKDSEIPFTRKNWV